MDLALKILDQEDKASAPAPATVPAYPPPVPQVPITMSSNLGSFISNKTKAEIQRLVTPLAKSELPDPQDLSLFWDDCEQALEGVHPSIQTGLMGPLEVSMVAPVLLGAAGWHALKHLHPGAIPTWHEFKRITNEHFGLNKE